MDCAFPADASSCPHIPQNCTSPSLHAAQQEESRARPLAWPVGRHFEFAQARQRAVWEGGREAVVQTTHRRLMSWPGQRPPPRGERVPSPGPAADKPDAFVSRHYRRFGVHWGWGVRGPAPCIAAAPPAAPHPQVAIIGSIVSPWEAKLPRLRAAAWGRVADCRYQLLVLWVVEPWGQETGGGGALVCHREVTQSGGAVRETRAPGARPLG